jgi:putative glutamine amidotransferase
MTRPRIGITCKLAIDAAWCPAVAGVRKGYVEAIVAAGGTPLLIPPLVDEATLRQIYELMDGILLSGGEDIDPAWYGETPHPKLGAVEPLRDAIELPLARWAVADNKPLLAICRGMQVLNVALGGSLYQDINSQCSTTIEHEAGSIQQCWENLDHTITLNHASRLADLLGATELEVNSLHHQALKEIGTGLEVTGCAPDGVVEAVEVAGHVFAIGVQCHPEQLWQQVDPRWRQVFAALVETAARAGDSRDQRTTHTIAAAC